MKRAIFLLKCRNMMGPQIEPDAAVISAGTINEYTISWSLGVCIEKMMGPAGFEPAITAISKAYEQTHAHVEAAS